MTPELCVIVDTEEEFDWDGPFSRDNVSTSSVTAQGPAHALFDRYGIVPTYVLDYPVATDPEAVRFLSGLAQAGKAAIGAHLHPWVTPPHEEPVTTRNSYQGNLPPALERAKIATMTDAIERAFGIRPSVFKCGRNGFGPHTAATLAELGYRIDCSAVPFTDLGEDGGPSFRGWPTGPTWIDRERGLLELPLTLGFTGMLEPLGPPLQRLFDSPRARRLRIPGALGRFGLLRRTRLSPEGYSAEELILLLDTLAARGRRTFCLTYHSPSLAPGHTPYVKDEAGLARFLATLEAVLDHFAQRLGGRFVTPDQVWERMTAEPLGRPAPVPPQSALRAALG